MKMKNSEANQKLITPRQLTILLVLSIFGGCAIFMYTPRDPQHGWITYFVAGLGEMVLLWIYLLLYKKNGMQPLQVILRNCLGKIAGTVVAFFYAAFFLSSISLTLASYSGYLRLNNYFDTPKLFITFVMGIIVIYALFKGLRVMARASEFFVWAILAVTVIVDILLVHYMKWDNIYPLKNIEILPILSDAFLPLTLIFGAGVAFLVIFPDAGSEREIKKPLFTGLGILIIVLTILFLRTLLVLGGNMINRYTYPCYFAYSISYPLKFGVFASTVLSLSILTRVFVFVYAAIVILKNIFRTRFSLFIVPAVLTVSLAGAYLFKNVVELLDFLKGIWAYCTAVFVIGIPVILLLISLIKKTENKQPEQSGS